MKQVLICDDEPHIVEGLRHLLRSPDRTITIARSGKEALQHIEDAVPDLLILDIMMPRMSGLDVLSTLRQKDKTKALPIIILTAKGEAQDTSMAQEVWQATVIAKPFEPQKLRKLVTATLEDG